MNYPHLIYCIIETLSKSPSYFERLFITQFTVRQRNAPSYLAGIFFRFTSKFFYLKKPGYSSGDVQYSENFYIFYILIVTVEHDKRKMKDNEFSIMFIWAVTSLYAYACIWGNFQKFSHFRKFCINFISQITTQPVQRSRDKFAPGQFGRFPPMKYVSLYPLLNLLRSRAIRR